MRLTAVSHSDSSRRPIRSASSAKGSASIDLHQKQDAYRRAGVPEYVVWRTEDAALDWFLLEAGEYVRVEPDEHGGIESAAFPGLRLNVPKLLAELAAPAAGE